MVRGLAGGAAGLGTTLLGAMTVAFATDDLVWWTGVGKVLIYPGVALVVVGPSFGHFAMGKGGGGVLWLVARLGLAGLGAASKIEDGAVIGYTVGTIATFVDIPFSAARLASGPRVGLRLQVLPGARTPVVLTGRF